MSAGLGKCVAEYETSRAGFAKVVAIMLVSFAVAAGLCVASMVGGPGDVGGRVVMFVLGVLSSAPGLLCIYGLTRGRKNAIRFHERGIAVHHAGCDTSIPWDDVASYRGGAFLVVEATSGACVEFGMVGLSGADEIMARLQREVVTLRTLPRWRTALLEGQSIDLHGARFDAAGITLLDGERRVPWSAITACAREEAPVTAYGNAPLVTTRVAIGTANGPLYLAVDDTSEADAIVALCNDRRA